LAKLIQLKQEARKAGQKAKERLELTRQLRCTVLLEALLSGKADGWGTLLRIDTVLQIGVELLQYYRELEKSLSKAGERGMDQTGEKKAMFDRISLLIKGKLLKTKVATLKWSTGLDAETFTRGIMTTLYKAARSSDSKDHRNLCSNVILLLIRATGKGDDKLLLANVYSDAVQEWASKRTTHFESSFFDHLIHQAPTVAQASLPRALASAAISARSSFLKSESLRLISQLYNPKLSSSDGELGELATANILDASNGVLQAIVSALKDEEMKKSKRIKEVLKAAEKVSSFLIATHPSVPFDGETLVQLKTLLTALRDETNNQGVRKSCDKVIEDIEKLKPQDPENDDVDAGKEHTRSSKKRKKPKSSKKDKRNDNTK
jgi:hypothetical protein